MCLIPPLEVLLSTHQYSVFKTASIQMHTNETDLEKDARNMHYSISKCLELSDTALHTVHNIKDSMTLYQCRCVWCGFEPRSGYM